MRYTIILSTSHRTPGICSATKKVRKVDIRYALCTFQIFWYTFGTHLTQKVDIFITSDKIADTIRISISIVVILSISHNLELHSHWSARVASVQLTAVPVASYSQVLTSAPAKDLPSCDFSSRRSSFLSFLLKSTFWIKWFKNGTQSVRILSKNWYTFGTHLPNFG